MGFSAAHEYLVTEKIHGLAELEATLNQLPEKIASRIFRQAINKGAQVFRAEAARLAPRGKTRHPPEPKLWYERHPGKLKRNIAVSIKVKSQGVRGSEVIAKIGLRRKPAIQDVYYGRFIEKGTSKMDAKPFMRPAFDTKKYEVIEVVAEALRTKLEDAVKAAGGGKQPRI